MESSAAAPTRGWRAYLPDGLILLFLLCLVAKLTYHIDAVRDLPVYDDAFYMWYGVGTPQHGPPPAESGPLYTLWYFAASLLQHDPVHLYYLSWSLLVGLLVAGFYLLVRALGGTRAVGLLAAFLVLTSELVNAQPHVSHLATILLELGVALAIRVRPRCMAVAVLACALLLASYARPEFYVAFLLLCGAGLAGGLWTLWRAPGRWRVLAASALLVLLPAGLLGKTLGVPLGGGRSFCAFGQHYIMNVATAVRRPLPKHAELNFDQVVREDFGDAQTIGAALRANPRTFLWHVGCNAQRLPLALVETVAPDLNLAVPGGWVVDALAGALVVLGGLGLYRRLVAPRPVGNVRGPRLALAALAVVLAPTAGACLVIWPHAHYLMPAATLALALAASGLPHAPGAKLWAALDGRRGLPALAAALLLLTPNRAGRCWDLQSWVGLREPHMASALLERRIAGALRTLHFDRPVVLLAPGGRFRAYYGRLPGGEVYSETKTGGFRDFIRRTGVTVVVIDPFLAADVLYRDDPEFREFMAAEHADGFTRLDVPGLPVCIAVRDDVLPATARAAP